MVQLVDSFSLLLALLNPFLLVVYLVDLLRKLDRRQFRRVLTRAGYIAAPILCSFSILGDTIFSSVLRAEFASFQIFGGLVFVLIGIQFVLRGPTAIEILRGDSEYLAGAIAMPVLIGPGTVSASVIIGKRHEPLTACAVVLGAVLASLVIVIVLKTFHDHVRPHHERLVERYIEIAGRVTALYVGTVAIDMLMRGIRSWLDKF